MDNSVDRYDVEAMIRDALYSYASESATADEFRELWEAVRELGEKVAGLERAFHSRTDHLV